jgi:hypothetical protein
LKQLHAGKIQRFLSAMNFGGFGDDRFFRATGCWLREACRAGD